MTDWYNAREPTADERISEIEETLLKVADILDVRCKLPGWEHPENLDDLELP